MRIHDQPTEPGLYVAYVNNKYIPTWADRKFLMWHDGEWWYPASTEKHRSHVYGCIGPLPSMALET